MEVWQYRSQRLTFVLVVASVTLIGPGLLDVGATVFTAAALASLAGALWLIREELRALPSFVGYDLGWYARDSYLGALVGAAVVLVSLGASPAELQALGGISGFLGMVNYFLRPVYLYLAVRLRQLVAVGA